MQNTNTVDTKTSGCTCQAESRLTIAECLDTILEYVSSDDLPINDGDGKGGLPEKEYDYVCGRLDISRKQAEIFAAIVELSLSGNATADRVARRLRSSNLHFMSLHDELDGLCRKRYVRTTPVTYRNSITYHVPEDIIKCLQNNDVPSVNDISGLRTPGLIKRMRKRFRDYWKDIIDCDALVYELNELMHHNQECIFVKEYNRMGIGSAPACEQLLFLFMITRLYEFQEFEFSWNDVRKLFDDSNDEDVIRYGIETGDLHLIRMGIIENANNDGIVDNRHLCFAEGMAEQILAEVKISRISPACRHLIANGSITEKKLFFNATEQEQIKTLTSLLDRNNFSSIVSRLHQKGMRPGFCALFYGSPGTGKTESAYQIARMTGRDIFLVDVSQLKSKWVGESEKNVKAIFDEYKSIVKNSETAPILLFNEADAIFGIRMSGAERAVDKMENSLQNIILQEMENLQGIMIATTNLTENFDPAFERRFIYKVKFNKPNPEARSLIWESMVEGLSSSSANSLARDFDFSGGQIENISRKSMVDYILSGNEPTLEDLRKLCEAETLSSDSRKTKIGFTS